VITDAERLYQPYTNKGTSADAVHARMRQRLKWLRRYQQCGQCRQKLIKAGILRGEG
jgi:hypothetical protein